MAVNILLLSCVAVASVRGQFLDAEYRLDSVPLPIRRRMDSARFEVLPSIGREVVLKDVSTDTTRVAQGRRHIDTNRNSNRDNGQNIRKFNIFEVKPYENIYLTDETRTADRRTNDDVRSQKYYEDQNGFQLQQQQHIQYNQDSGVKKNNNNAEQLSRIHTQKGDNRLRTNLDNKQGSSNQSHSRSQENVTSVQNVNYNESKLNYQIKSTGVSENKNKSNENNRSSGNQNNGNIYTEASQRAIDSNPYRNQQNVDSSNYNNRNYNTKPKRQNTETRKEENNRHIQTTEPNRRYTTLPITVTGRTKSTEDNELVSRVNSEGRSEDDDDRWIWMSSSNTTSEKNKNTTVAPTLPTVDDRAAFSGDKCPTGQVRYNNRCVDED